MIGEPKPEGIKAEFPTLENLEEIGKSGDVEHFLDTINPYFDKVNETITDLQETIFSPEASAEHVSREVWEEELRSWEKLRQDLLELLRKYNPNFVEPIDYSDEVDED